MSPDPKVQAICMGDKHIILLRPKAAHCSACLNLDLISERVGSAVIIIRYRLNDV